MSWLNSQLQFWRYQALRVYSLMGNELFSCLEFFHSTSCLLLFTQMKPMHRSNALTQIITAGKTLQSCYYFFFLVFCKCSRAVQWWNLCTNTNCSSKTNPYCYLGKTWMWRTISQAESQAFKNHSTWRRSLSAWAKRGTTKVMIPQSLRGSHLKWPLLL